MSTTSSIGSGKTYSDPGSWHSAFATGGWIGECYAPEITTTSTYTFSGKTTSATDYITLTAHAGESFQDNANVQTNALRYNASNGAAIRKTSAYGAVLTISEKYVTISRLQFAHTGGGNDNRGIECTSFGGVTGQLLDSLIVEHNSPSGSIRYIVSATSGGIINSLLINRGTTGNGLEFAYPSGVYAVNCTIVRPSDKTAAGTAIASSTGTWTVKNCAIFGFTTLNAGGTASGSNNCSDLAIGFGSSNQASKTYANQFQDATDATRDFRLKSGADCIQHGVIDTTNVPSGKDIALSTRGATNWDMGCWEYQSAAVTPTWFGNLHEGANQPLFDRPILVAA